jgi:hypothetical protein
VAVPTAVVVTTRDRIVPVARQHKLAAAIPDAVVFEVAADHGVCVTAPDLFARVLLAACQSVRNAVCERLAATISVDGDGANGSVTVPRGDRPTTTNPVPNATSRTWRPSRIRSRWHQGRSMPSKPVT